MSLSSDTTGDITVGFGDIAVDFGDITVGFGDVIIAMGDVTDVLLRSGGLERPRE